jgi:hypothetical protein
MIEIDHYGERLVGCIECNRWSWLGSERSFMELLKATWRRSRRSKKEAAS